MSVTIAIAHCGHAASLSSHVSDVLINPPDQMNGTARFRAQRATSHPSRTILASAGTIENHRKHTHNRRTYKYISARVARHTQSPARSAVAPPSPVHPAYSFARGASGVGVGSLGAILLCTPETQRRPWVTSQICKRRASAHARGSGRAGGHGQYDRQVVRDRSRTREGGHAHMERGRKKAGGGDLPRRGKPRCGRQRRWWC